MEGDEHQIREQMVRLTLDLPVSVLVWLDAVKTEMGLRSRGVVVAQLLKELASGPDDQAVDASAPDAA
jgi:hypothetical protein